MVLLWFMMSQTRQVYLCCNEVMQKWPKMCASIKNGDSVHTELCSCWKTLSHMKWVQAKFSIMGLPESQMMWWITLHSKIGLSFKLGKFQWLQSVQRVELLNYNANSAFIQWNWASSLMNGDFKNCIDPCLSKIKHHLKIPFTYGSSLRLKEKELSLKIYFVPCVAK